mmetsp:Transcript_27780/g.46488  ORF Transcript_27780/g.46488 Transcript_27780/m.46488 type:complete len:81 (-) Transcript_27780:14-256(-)
MAAHTALTTINLAHCNKVTDEGLKALTLLTALTCLDLGYSRQVTYKGLRALLASLTALTRLNLTGCYRIIDGRLRTLAQH